MRDLISTAIFDSQVQHATNGQTRWQVTFVNNATWTGTIEKLGTAYVLYTDKAPIYFAPSQVIYLTMAVSEQATNRIRHILNN